MANRSVRGAITVEQNSEEAILQATARLLSEMIRSNDLEIERIVSVLFTVTRDLTKAYPAAAARKLGLTRAALMCVQEMFVEDSLEKCIRAQMDADMDRAQSDVRHVYLGGARRLRPDLAYNGDGQPGESLYAIAIDGPSGAGKSTIAKMVAERLGFVYVDTGAMYRAAALHCLKNGVDPEDGNAVAAEMTGLDIDIAYVDGAQRVLLNGDDVTDDIRSTPVSDGASKVAVFQGVREKLVGLQRRMAEKTSVVMDGRDIGTHVLPDAALKIYLDASVSERARRRVAELKERGFEPEYESVFKDIEERDIRDTGRAVSPLRKAVDALVLDSSDMNCEEVARAIEDAFLRR